MDGKRKYILGIEATRQRLGVFANEGKAKLFAQGCMFQVLCVSTVDEDLPAKCRREWCWVPGKGFGQA